MLSLHTKYPCELGRNPLFRETHGWMSTSILSPILERMDGIYDEEYDTYSSVIYRYIYSNTGTKSDYIDALASLINLSGVATEDDTDTVVEIIVASKKLLYCKRAYDRSIPI